MRFFEFKITESKGIFGRIPDKDQYLHTDGRTAIFKGIVSRPDPADGGGQFESKEERDKDIETFEKNNNAKITWTNVPGNNLAYAVAIVQTSENQTEYWGRYFRLMKVSMISAWQNKDIPVGWKLQTSGATKMDRGLEPQSLIKTPKQFSGAQEVIDQVKANARDEDKEILAQALVDSSQGKMAVFPGQKEIETAIRDYFGEIMGPVAMMGGAVLGQAEDARNELAGGADWKDCKVIWPQDMNEPLIDSKFFAPNGKTIGISSKGGVGASASIVNLYNGLLRIADENDDGTYVGKNDNHKKFIAENQVAIDVIRTIQKNPAKKGPFELGVQFGLCSRELFEEATRYQQAGKVEFEGMSDEATKIVGNTKFNTKVIGFNVGNAITAALVKEVGNHVNNKTNFSDAALALLNNASIIQLYTKTKLQGDDVVVTNYNAVYPPKFSGRIGLDGGKNYYSTRIGGKFSFKFLKGA